MNKNKREKRLKILSNFNSKQIEKYFIDLRNKGLPKSQIYEKVKSIEIFLEYLKKNDLIEPEKEKSIKEILNFFKKETKPKRFKKLFSFFKNKFLLIPKFFQGKSIFAKYIGLAGMLVITAFLGATISNRIFKKTDKSLAYPLEPTRAGRTISFQGRLTDSIGNPIITKTDMIFRLYNAETGGTVLYTGSCTGTNGITPDQDGVFNVIIGSDCGMSEIPASVFTENPEVYLEVEVASEIMTPRQPIANVGYAMNAETLQGLPPDDGSNTTSFIPFIDKNGNMMLAVSNPAIRSTLSTANFELSSAKAFTITSAGLGDIVLQATESGAIKFRTQGSTDTETRMIIDNLGRVGIGTPNPNYSLEVIGNIRSDSTIYADGGISTTTGGLILDSFSGSTTINDNLIVNGSIKTNLSTGVVHSDSSGNLSSILGTTNYIPKWTSTGLSTTSNIYENFSGNVGIGTTSPGAKLDVSGDAIIYHEQADGLVIQRNTMTKGKSGGGLFLTGGGYNSDKDWGGIFAGTWTDLGTFRTISDAASGISFYNGTIVFKTASGLAGDGSTFSFPTRMIIDSSGNVGIGTTSPSYKLDVAGTGKFSGDLTLASVSSLADNNKVLTVDASGVVKYIDTSSWDKNSADDVSTFLNLTDTPSSYSGSGGYFVKVKSDESGLEFATASSISPWNESSGIIYPYTLSNNVSIGTSSNVGKLGIVGDTDEVQLYLKGFSTQTNNLVEVRKSDNTLLLSLNNSGSLNIFGNITASTTDTINGLSISSGSITDALNITMSGTLDLGTNTIYDGNFTGNWNFNNGNLSGINDLTAGGTITFSGLTANRLVSTTTGGQLTTSISSSGVAASVTDETGSGYLVFNDSPVFTTKITVPVVYGSSSASGNLTLESTSNSTKGYVLINPNGGNVGIGTTNPGYKLDVTEDIRASNSLIASANDGSVPFEVTPGAVFSVAHYGHGAMIPNWFAEDLLAFKGILKVEKWNSNTSSWDDITASYNWNNLTSRTGSTIDVGTNSRGIYRFTFDVGSNTHLAGAFAMRTNHGISSLYSIKIEASTDNFINDNITILDKTQTVNVNRAMFYAFTDGTNAFKRYLRVTMDVEGESTINIRFGEMYFFRVSGQGLNFANQQIVPVKWDTSLNLQLRADGSVTTPALSFVNDTDTGIFRPTTNSLGLITGGIERLRINSSGNLGIGTTNPQQKLSVAGSLGIIEGGSSPTYYTIFQGGDQSSNITYTLPTSIIPGGFLTTDASGVLSWTTTVPATSVKWNNITDPDGNLTLNHSTYTTTFNSSITTGTFFTINANSLTSGTGLYLSSTSTGLTGDLVKIEASGNNSGVTGNVLKVGLTGASATGTALNVTTAGSSGFALRVNDDGTYNDSTPFVVDASGNVGIGTTSPSGLLEIAHNTDITKTLLNISYSGSEKVAIRYDQNSNYHFLEVFGNTLGRFGTSWATADWPQRTVYVRGHSDSAVPFTIISYDSTPGNDLFQVYGGSEVFEIDSSGNVGIGTTSPSYKLDVQGGSGIVAQFSGRVIGAEAQNPNEFVTLSQLQGGSGSLWLDGGDYLYPNSSFATKVRIPSGGLAVGYNNDPGTSNLIVSGNVGIGTTNPEYKLDIVGETNINNHAHYLGYIDSWTSSASQWAKIAEFTVPLSWQTVHGTISIAGTRNYGASRGGKTEIFVSVATNDTGLYTPKIQWVKWGDHNIKNVRLVQITSSDPYKYELWIQNNIAQEGDFSIYGQFEGRFSKDRIVWFKTPTWQSTAPTGVAYWDAESIARFDSNVGIGTTSPSYKLDVAGQVRIQTLNTGSTDTVVTHNNGVLQTRTIDPDVWSGVDNYQYWVLKSSAGDTGYNITSQASAIFNAGSGITTSRSTNTITISHADTSTQGSVNNSALTFIQDITLDDFGHITGLVSNSVGASNGLSVSGNNIILGGTLTQSTTITQGNYDMIFNLTGTGDFRVQDNGTDVLFVRDDGNVGIGTTGPDVPLEVTGQAGKGIKVSGTNIDPIISFEEISEGAFWHVGLKDGYGTSANNNAFAISTNSDLSSPALMIQTNGNIGIGTTNPNYNLDVVGDIYASTLIKSGGDVIGSRFLEPNLNFGIDPAGTSLGPSSGFSLRISGGAILAEASGSVGIGTINPGSYKLNVNGDIYSAGTITFPTIDPTTKTSHTALSFPGTGDGSQIIYEHTATDIYNLKIRMYDNTLNDAFKIWFDDYRGPSYDRYPLEVRGDKVLLVQDGGNVGIGTTSPSYKLDVAGEVRIQTLNAGSTDTVVTHNNGVLQTRTIDPDVWSAVDNYQYWVLKSTAADTGYNISSTQPAIFSGLNGIKSLRNNNQIDIKLGGSLSETTTITQGSFDMIFNLSSTGDFRIQDNGTDVLFVRDDGNIGIGNNNPGTKLDVAGSAYIDGLRLDGRIAASSFPDPENNYALVFNSGSGGLIHAAGSTAPFKLHLQDGHGRVSYLWNVEENGGTYNYAVSSEGANWFLTDNGKFTFYTAPGGTAGNAISWNTGLHIDTFGNAGIATTQTSRAKLTIGDSTLTSINSPWGSGANLDAFGLLSYDPTPVGNDKNLYGISGVAKEFGATGATGYRTGTHGILIKSDETDWYVGGVLGGQSGPRQLAYGVAGSVKACPTGYTCYTGFFTSPVNANFVVENGNVGIGILNPNYRLSVIDTPTYSTVNFTNAQTADNQNYGVLALRVGTSSSGINTRFIKFLAGSTNDQGGTGVGRIRLNNGGVAYESGGADFAEYFYTLEKIENGDIVAISKTDNKVKKATKKDPLLGVVSNKAAFIGNAITETPQSNQVIVGLMGQVKTKVTTVNGPIKPGDPITISDIPGVGMKATKPGQIIGRALESYDNPDPKAIGKITILVHTSWYDPDIYLTSTGDLQIIAENQDNNLIPQTYTVKNKAGELIQRISAFAEIIVAKIKAGLVTAENIVVNNILTAKNIIAEKIEITSENLIIAGKSIPQYIDERIENYFKSREINVAKKVYSPVVETKEIKLNSQNSVIKTTEDNAKINITDNQNNTLAEFKTSEKEININGDLKITQTKEASQTGKLAKIIIENLDGKEVVRIDSSGNAKFNGNLQAKKIEAEEIEITGKLKVKDIEAENINTKILKIENKLTQIIKEQESSPEAKTTEDIKPLYEKINEIQSILAQIDNQQLPDPNYYFNLEPKVKLDYTSAKDIFIENSLIANNIAASNSLTVGKIFMQDTNIITLENKLNLIAAEKISFFEDLVAIDNQGNLTTEGIIIAKGGIKTDTLEPINKDITIKLPQNSEQENSKVKIENNQGEEVAYIDASGSAYFKELNLDKYNPATPESDIILAENNPSASESAKIITENKTAGIGIIPKNSQIIKIYTNKAKKDSLIYLTPTSPDIKGQLTVSKQEDGFFEVLITEPNQKEVKFNWLIIN